MPVMIRVKRTVEKDTAGRKPKSEQVLQQKVSPSKQRSRSTSDTIMSDTSVVSLIATTVKTVDATPTTSHEDHDSTTLLPSITVATTPESWTPMDIDTPTGAATPPTSSPPVHSPATPTAAGETVSAVTPPTSSPTISTTSSASAQKEVTADDENPYSAGDWLEEDNVRHFVCNEPGDTGLNQVVAFEVEGTVVKRFLAGGGKYGYHTLSMTIDESALTSIRSVVKSSPDFSLRRNFHIPISDNIISFKCKDNGGEFRNIYEGRPGYNIRIIDPRDIGIGAKVLVEFSVYSWDFKGEERKASGDQKKASIGAGCTFRLRQIDLLEAAPTVVDFESPKKRKLQ